MHYFVLSFATVFSDIQEELPQKQNNAKRWDV